MKDGFTNSVFLVLAAALIGILIYTGFMSQTRGSLTCEPSTVTFNITLEDTDVGTVLVSERSVVTESSMVTLSFPLGEPDPVEGTQSELVVKLKTLDEALQAKVAAVRRVVQLQDFAMPGGPSTLPRVTLHELDPKALSLGERQQPVVWMAGSERFVVSATRHAGACSRNQKGEQQ